MVMVDYFYLFIANILALFPIVNPVGTGFIVNNNFLSALNHEEKKIILKKVARMAFFICVGALLIGKFLLALFGLSIPIIQIAGGAIICRNGWLFFLDDTGNSDEQFIQLTGQTYFNYRFRPGYRLRDGAGAGAIRCGNHH